MAGFFDRWDRQNQRIVERQNRRDSDRVGRYKTTHVEAISPSGERFEVVAEPSGYPLRPLGGSGSIWDIPVEFAVAAVAWLRHRYQYRGGWTVAILEPESMWRRAKVRMQERVSSREQAEVKVADLAEAIRSGGPRSEDAWRA